MNKIKLTQCRIAIYIAMQHHASMKQHLALTAIVVRDYDEAIAFYVNTLGFDLVEDTYIFEQDKRWVVIAPPGSGESRLLLARAVGDEQSSRVAQDAACDQVYTFLHKTNGYF